jgi:hypothetical protein
MARLRTIKPEMYTNDDLARCSLAARYLFPGLWCYADRRGILEDRPLRLKANLYPFDDVDVNGLLQELHDAGFIRRYTAQGVRCIVIIKFTKHQNPHIHEKPNDLPEPPASTEESMQASDEHSTSTVLAPYENGASTAPICLTELSCELSYGVEAGEPAPPPATKPKRSTRMTNDWRPGPGVRKVANEIGLSDTERKSELVKFRDHFLANGKAMANWDAAAQNWLRRSREFASGPIPIRGNGRSAASLSDQMDQWVREIEEGR